LLSSIILAIHEHKVLPAYDNLCHEPPRCFACNFRPGYIFQDLIFHLVVLGGCQIANTELASLPRYELFRRSMFFLLSLVSQVFSNSQMAARKQEGL